MATSKEEQGISSNENSLISNGACHLVSNLLSNLTIKEKKDDIPPKNTSLIDKYYGPEPITNSSETCSSPSTTDDNILKDFDYVVEVYGFSPSLKTKNIFKELKSFRCSQAMKLKWVDDTHALIIYTTAEEARYVTMQSFVKIKTQLLSSSTHKASLDMAQSVAESIRTFLCDLIEPSSLTTTTSNNKKSSSHIQSSGATPLKVYSPHLSSFPLHQTSLSPSTTTCVNSTLLAHDKEASNSSPSTCTSSNPDTCTNSTPVIQETPHISTDKRPQSSASVARRMISHALGVPIRPSPEQKEKESKLLEEAKERKLQKKVSRATIT